MNTDIVQIHGNAFACPRNNLEITGIFVVTLHGL